MKTHKWTISCLLLAGTMMLAQAAQKVEITKGPVVENTSSSSAVVAWSTNVSSGTQVKYGLDQNNLSQTAQAPWGSLTHRVSLKNLEPGKTYYYQVVSGQAQGSGTSASSPVQSFSTSGQSAGASGQPEKSSPGGNVSVVAGPVARQVTGESARIWWQTNAAAPTVVKYGTDRNNLSGKKDEPGNTEMHDVEITGLKPDTQYFVQIESASGQPLEGSSFKTSGNLSKGRFYINSGPDVESLGDTTATVVWSTSRPSSAIVKYGTSPTSMTQTAEAKWGPSPHRVELKGLKPNTRYYIEVHSAQPQGQPGESASAGPFPIKTGAPGQTARAQ